MLAKNKINENNKFDSSGNLLIGGISAELLAEQYGTPIYVYDQNIIYQKIKEWKKAIAEFAQAKIFYSVKANNNLHILNFFNNADINFDIVSGGELAKLLKVGVSGSRIIFSGVGKSKQEINEAVAAKIHCFNVESETELERLAGIGKNLQYQIPISIRINPNINPKTHPYISTGLKDNKFGMAIEQAKTAINKFYQNQFLDIQGLACHIGSNLHDPAPFHLACQALLDLTEELSTKGIHISHLDCGGGIGVGYQPNEDQPQINDFILPIIEMIKKSKLKVEIRFEPGRSLIAEAGTLITKIENIKSNGNKKFIVVDASMTELLRPVLYQSWHEIVPIKKSSYIQSNNSTKLVDVVGPVCESSDILGRDRKIDTKIDEYLAIKNVGAYGFVMSNNYNSRPRPAEIWIENQNHKLIRKRESYQDLMRNDIW